MVLQDRRRDVSVNKIRNSRSKYGWYYSPGAGFFEQDNDQTNSYIMPDDTYIWEYFSVANRTGKRAKALLWWWYPDAYASSFEAGNEQMGVLPVHNVWADQQDIWLAADLGWKP